MTPNITEWSDFELNKAIAELVYPNNEFEKYARGKSSSVCLLDEPTEFQTIVNYCESWESLMPLVHDLGLTMKPYKWKSTTEVELWIVEGCYKLTENHRIIIKDLQRALAECVYLVLLAKSKEQDSELSQ